MDWKLLILLVIQWQFTATLRLTHAIRVGDKFTRGIID